MFLVAKTRFTWRDAKAAKNISKHGVAFDEASTVFADPHATFDKDWANGEKRLLVIGMSSRGRLLYVVGVSDPDGLDAFHIISARELTKKERRAYEEGH